MTLGPIASVPPVDSTPDANAFVQRAVSLYEQGKAEAALAEYRKGLKNDPLDSDTWYGLAETLHEMGRTKQAIETYTLALSTIEHAPELRVPFARLLLETKKKSEAVKVLQRGVELDPDASDMKAMLGNVLVGVLDENNAVDTDDAPAATVTGSAAAAPGAKASAPSAAKPKAAKKRKKLCKLFCPGTIQPIAPASK